MGTTFNRSGNTGVLLMEGELTLPTAGDLRMALIKALLDADEISIAFQNVREVDLSCLQLLCSANRSAARLKKRVALAGQLPTACSQLTAAAGFERQSGCKLECGENCLWAAAGEKND